MTTRLEQESDRIRAEYRRRKVEIPSDFYALHRPANLFIRHGQELALLRALQNAGLVPLSDRTILDLGCGSGQWFVTFENFGAIQSKLAGIDLDKERAQHCQQRFPVADVRVGDARELPWDDVQFDIVFQSTVFTSILDTDMKNAIAAEMLRVLKPTGHIIWYDFIFNNPRNEHVRGISMRELQGLFPNCIMRSKRVTLAPPLARWLAPYSFTLAATLEHMKFLNTHCLALLRRR